MSASLSTLATLLILGGTTPVFPMSTATGDPTGPEQHLTAAQQTQLRKAVYEDGYLYSVSFPPPLLGKRCLIVPEAVAEAHKTNRAETIGILYDIVKGGRPADAVKALSFMVALEKGPVEAALESDYPVEYVDREGADAGKSGRFVFLGTAKEIHDSVTKATKKP
jgi:hypothetical protein